MGVVMEMLVGEEIVLREYRLSDAAAIHRWKNDRETTLWMGRRFRRPFTLEETTESLTNVINRPAASTLFFAIADKATLEYRGGIDLTDIDSTDRNAVMSLVIGQAADRGRGYASEAIQLLLSHAFGPLGLHKVSLNVNSRNLAAHRCYLKNGFRDEGRIRDHWFIDGEYCDLIPMGILASEYPPPQKVVGPFFYQA